MLERDFEALTEKGDAISDKLNKIFESAFFKQTIFKSQI